jgi:hypothetical protein
MKKAKKKCKGTHTLTKGLGCGNLTEFRTKGLCRKCYAKFLFSDEGKKEREKFLIKNKKKVQKEKKQKLKKEKEAIKSHADYLDILQDEINIIVRLIDVDEGCISCDHGHNNNFTRKADAGHFYSVGGHSSIRFNFHNIYKQCSVCNTFLSGNDREYKNRLISKFGIEYFEKHIESLKSVSVKLTREELKQKIKIARKIKSEIKKGKVYDRFELNNILGIY